MISARCAAALGTLFCLFPAGFVGAAAQPAAAIEPLDQAICRLIENSARADHLPVAFLTRIIWRESSFRAGALSPVGAQGIAQFMPQTARERGLAHPFDPEQAIPKAARLLADLRQQFGNLGIAAAAYNAGPARVQSWLHGQGGLPVETRVYVRLVTERDAEAWIGPSTGAGSSAPRNAGSVEPPAAESCLAVTADLRRDRSDDIGLAALAPWGVQLAGNFSKALALAAFERARRRDAAVIGDLQPMIIGRLLRSRGTRRFYQIRLPAASRQEAATLCDQIRSVGGNCVAMRS
ncbi:MAG: lytic transglycosylase domain-containing protein [Stellaceae bacterium]